MRTCILSSDLERLQSVNHDMVYAGAPRFVCDAGDWQDVAAVLADSQNKKLPVTFCGSQTSMTGASVADDGLALRLMPKNKILEIGKDAQTGEGFVITEPGVILGDLKRAVWDAGYFYPPDPTSFNEAQIGSTVATNATGEDTFKYGPTRRYVQELDIMMADGTTRTLKRKHEAPLTPIKNTGGYFLDGEDIDEVIGSEGTLALITRIKLKLLQRDGKDTLLLVLPFSDFTKTIYAVQEILKQARQPRALELIGPGAGEYFRSHPACPPELARESCFLYLKEEFDDADDRDRKIETWFKQLKEVYRAVDDEDCLKRIFIATTDAQKEAIRLCRHHIPLKVNEDFFPFAKQGGGKIGTDWWVPPHHLHEMMLPTFEKAQKLGIPFLVFAHIGNGHPHWNFLTRTPEENAAAKKFVLEQCRQAVLFGGGVAGEHGIGKIKRDLLAIQHAPKTIKKLMAIKQKWDPDWILGRGNLFVPPGY
jgi:FAD/FMN-containing dehydrogenase